MFPKVRITCGKIPDHPEPEKVCCLISLVHTEGAEAPVTQVMPRQVRCRVNEKRKELGVSEPLGAGREERAVGVQSDLPRGSEGTGQHTVRHHGQRGLPRPALSQQEEGPGSGVRQTCVYTPVLLSTCVAPHK